jgi:L-lactate dehydrogenase complex protein LldG
MAAAANATVDVVDGATVPEDLVQQVIDEHHVARAVISDEPLAAELGEMLRALGVTIDGVAPADADLGVTGASAGIASTGSLMLDCARAGSRVVSLLPTVHLCVVHADSIVATPSDVLRVYGAGASAAELPSNLVLVTGPSRTGDIEQILTLGVHGPTALRIFVLRG